MIFGTSALFFLRRNVSEGSEILVWPLHGCREHLHGSRTTPPVQNPQVFPRGGCRNLLLVALFRGTALWMGPPCPRYSFLHIMFNTSPLDLCRMLHVPCFPLSWTMDGFLHLGFPRPSSRVFRPSLCMPCLFSSMLCAFDVVLPRLVWVVDCASVCVDGWDWCHKTLDSWEGSDQVEAEGPRRHTINGPLGSSLVPIRGRYGVGSIPTRTAEFPLGHHGRGGHDRCRSTFPSRGLRRRPFQPSQSSDPDPFLFLPFERGNPPGRFLSDDPGTRLVSCRATDAAVRTCAPWPPKVRRVRSTCEGEEWKGRECDPRTWTWRMGAWWNEAHRVDRRRRNPKRPLVARPPSTGSLGKRRRTIRVQSKQKPGSIEEWTQVERNGSRAGEGPHTVQWMMCVCDHTCATTMEKSCNEMHSSSKGLGTSNPMGDCKCDGENA